MHVVYLKKQQHTWGAQLVCSGGIIPLVPKQFQYDWRQFFQEFTFAMCPPVKFVGHQAISL
jgi:hypothetical protein